MLAQTVLIGDFSDSVFAAILPDHTPDRKIVTSVLLLVRASAQRAGSAGQARAQLVVLPLSLQRHLNDLRIIGFLSVVFVAFYTVGGSAARCGAVH